MVTRQELRPFGHFMRRFVALPEHRLLYVRNAKAGTNTTLLWLYRLHTGDHAWTPEGSVHASHQLPGAGALGWPAVSAMLDGGAVRFTFVRHPTRRAESAYLNKISREYRRSEPPDVKRVLTMQRALGLPEDPDGDITPDQFLAALEAEDPLDLDPHWRPQHLNLMHPALTYDVVGHLETYDADLARVRDLAGLPDVPLEARNASTAPRGMFDEPSLRRRVEALYARDYELYGY